MALACTRHRLGRKSSPGQAGCDCSGAVSAGGCGAHCGLGTGSSVPCSWAARDKHLSAGEVRSRGDGTPRKPPQPSLALAGEDEDQNWGKLGQAK